MSLNIRDCMTAGESPCKHIGRGKVKRKVDELYAFAVGKGNLYDFPDVRGFSLSRTVALNLFTYFFETTAGKCKQMIL